MNIWRCGCGYISEGDAPPDTCPKCGAPRDKFVRITEEAARLIDRSRLTNDLLMKLEGLTARVEEIATKGIEDNLDPGCLGVFSKAKDGAIALKQMIKAEIQTHVSKGKWG